MKLMQNSIEIKNLINKKFLQFFFQTWGETYALLNIVSLKCYCIIKYGILSVTAFLNVCLCAVSKKNQSFCYTRRSTG